MPHFNASVRSANVWRHLHANRVAGGKGSLIPPDFKPPYFNFAADSVLSIGTCYPWATSEGMTIQADIMTNDAAATQCWFSMDSLNNGHKQWNASNTPPDWLIAGSVQQNQVVYPLNVDEPRRVRWVCPPDPSAECWGMVDDLEGITKVRPLDPSGTGFKIGSLQGIGANQFLGGIKNIAAYRGAATPVRDYGRFDGATHYIDLPNLGLSLGNGVTITQEIKLEDSGVNHITHYFDAGDLRFNCQILSDGVFRIGYNELGTWYRGLGTYEFGKWSTSSLIYDGTTGGFSATLDGVSLPIDNGVLYAGGTEGYRIGASRDVGQLATGLIANVKMYDSNDTLIHHWPIDEGSGTTINDIVGGAHGTLAGDPLTFWRQLQQPGKLSEDDLVGFWALDDPTIGDGGTVPDLVGSCDGTLTHGLGSWITSMPSPQTYIRANGEYLTSTNDELITE